jgi:GT2 family glycosyltransferase
MNNDVPVIHDLSVFPDIPATTRLVIVLPTARWNPMARSVIGSMVGVADEEIAVLIADNSENPEKRAFLESIRSINPHILAVAHAQNVGVFNNCLYLYNWSRDIEFIAQIADDDWVSPTYFRDAYEVLRDNPNVSCAEVGSTWADMGDKRLINVSQRSMTGRTPLERMQKWNGSAARVTMYNASRRSCLDTAMAHFLASPLSGITLPEDLWELNRLAQGDFVSIPGHGCLIHYPAHASVSGDRSTRFYDLLCRDVGLSMPALFFMGLSTAVQVGIMLMGKDSPIADPRQRVPCGNYAFAQIFRTNFMPSLLTGMSDPQLLNLFERHPHFLNELKPFLEPPYSNSPVLNREIYELFVKLLRMTESRASNDEVLLSERFDRFARAHYWDLPELPAGDLTQYLTHVEATAEATPGASNAGQDTAEQTPQDFYKLWQMGHSYQDRDAKWMAERMETWARPPRFHLVAIVPEEGVDRLANNIRSLGHQFHSGWQLSIVAPVPVHKAVVGVANIAWVETMPEQFLATANRVLMDGTADWVGMFEAGDKLAPHAFFAFADKAVRHPELRLIYSDEDMLHVDNEHSTPFFKTDFNLEMLRAAPYVIGGLLLLDRTLFRELGGFDPTMEGVEYFDLVLRAWEAVGSAGIGHLADVLYHRYEQGGHSRRPTEELAAAHRLALQQHLQRCGAAAEIADGLLPGTLHVRYAVSGNPLVSILVPTRNQVELLKRCLTSLIEGTGYSNCEILVLDNGSDEADAMEYLEQLRGLNSERVRVLDCPGPFNFSAINNRGAREARGDYLVLLNNDTAVLHEEWLEEMLGIAQQQDVGAVGAKLFYPDGNIQHAGVILGINHAPADHPFIGQPSDATGYFGRLCLTQEYSAVTAACLLVRRALYLEQGGLDEERFRVSYNDVDFCLRLQQQGYRNVLTPHARLLHEESVSQRSDTETAQIEVKRVRFAAEQDSFYDSWRKDVAFDHAYNRNMSFHGREFLIEISPLLSLDPEWQPRTRVLAHPADRFGCGEYRVIAPMRALNKAGRVLGWETGNYLSIPELFRFDPEVMLLQRQVDLSQLQLMERYIRHSKAFRIYEIDDLITNIPVLSSRKKHFVEQKDLHKRFRKGISMCHRFIVSTNYLAEQYHGYVDDIVVVPNYIERARWGNLLPPRVRGAKPRVGWAGGSSHDGDLAIIADVVKATAQEVDWIFFGMCPDSIRPYVAESHSGVVLDEYPAKLASLDLDLAVAPLEDVPFNHGKSHLRLLEYGVLGYPVICTDITPYRGDFPVTRVPNKFKDWVEAIRSHVADRDELARRGDALRDYIEANWMLEDHLDVWAKAWLP